MTNTACLPFQLSRMFEEHRAEILERWLNKLDINTGFYPYRSKSDLQGALLMYLDAFDTFLNGKNPIFMEWTPHDSVLAEIHILLMGEEAVAKVLRKHSGEGWAYSRREISRMTHQVLRSRIKKACEQCRVELRQALARMRMMAEKLQRLNQPI